MIINNIKDFYFEIIIKGEKLSILCCLPFNYCYN